ncbi:MAG: thiolase family protein [Candidatus Dormibacteraeota bacterium]|uniref:acetyl-CoA C-acyltransferase n=2 Tax=Candidatus Aeolococcus gillhamiae TaxID=3127015 RepID=A0A934K038_9BACT|nr:thiolase family protein [Candidatus Dormibacteraeota bacterium]
MEAGAALFAAAVRTPMGRAAGQLASIRPDDLAADVIKALLHRVPALDPARVDEVVWGAANQAGEDNRNLARMAALLAGLPVEVPGATVNRLCGSGLEAVAAAARLVALGEADVVIAGGSESMSRAPFVVPRPDRAFPRAMEMVDTRLGWRLVNPRMAEMYPPISLGETAEEVADRYHVSREEQDEFAARSHRKAHAAQVAGSFDAEMVPLTLPSGRVIDSDEGVRPDASVETLAALAPVFRNEGTVTAGNSSPLNDGAAAVLVMSERAAGELGLTPLGRYVTTGTAGVHPDVMGIGPVPATRKALARAGWTLADVDLAEVNEAFASQSVAVVRELGLDEGCVNVNGGAIAIGHPLGCSGARLVTTLLHAMPAHRAQRGLATMCVGVGQGISMLVEAV